MSPGIFDTPGGWRRGEIPRQPAMCMPRTSNRPVEVTFTPRACQSGISDERADSSFGPTRPKIYWKVLLPPSSHFKVVTAASTRCTVVHDTRPVCACIQNIPSRSRKRHGLEPSHDFMLVKKCNVFYATLWPRVTYLNVAKSLRMIENCTHPLSLRPTASDFSDSAASSWANLHNVR